MSFFALYYVVSSIIRGFHNGDLAVLFLCGYSLDGSTHLKMGGAHSSSFECCLCPQFLCILQTNTKTKNSLKRKTYFFSSGRFWVQ